MEAGPETGGMGETLQRRNKKQSLHRMWPVDDLQTEAKNTSLTRARRLFEGSMTFKCHWALPPADDGGETTRVKRLWIRSSDIWQRFPSHTSQAHWLQFVAAQFGAEDIGDPRV